MSATQLLDVFFYLQVINNASLHLPLLMKAKKRNGLLFLLHMCVCASSHAESVMHQYLSLPFFFSLTDVALTYLFIFLVVLLHFLFSFRLYIVCRYNSSRFHHSFFFFPLLHNRFNHFVLSSVSFTLVALLSLKSERLSAVFFFFFPSTYTFCWCGETVTWLAKSVFPRERKKEKGRKEESLLVSTGIIQ